MRFSPPKNTTWMLATLLGLLGILGKYVELPFVSANSFWLVTAGFILLVLATLLKGL